MLTKRLINITGQGIKGPDSKMEQFLSIGYTEGDWMNFRPINSVSVA